MGMASWEDIEKEREEQNKLARERRRQAAMKRRKKAIRTHILLTIAVLCLLTGTFLLVQKALRRKPPEEPPKKVVTARPELLVDLLDINEYSRPGLALEQVNGIVIHYTANPGTTAEQNRNYFNGLKDSQTTKASSHFVIGIDGEIVQCVPCNEIAYASNERNGDTISIECCHEDETGRFNDKTEASLVHLTAWLMGRYGLELDDVIRHYDVTGKKCPLYYVENEDAWERFKQDVDAYIEAYGEVPEEIAFHALGKAT